MVSKVISGCYLCHSPRLQYKFSAGSDKADTYSIFACRDCGLIFTSPQPGPKEMEKYYTQGYYGEDVKRLSFLKQLFLNLFQAKRRKLITFYKKGGRLLDIGCGDGRFLKEMIKPGWEVYGVDTAKTGANFWSRIKGITCYHQELTRLDLPSEYFDVITLWHVLEHIRDPRRELQEIVRILRKGGLLIVAVPNFDSLQARFGRGIWFHLDPPRHLWHFSPCSISFMIEQAGLTIEQRRFLSWSYNLFGWWQTMLNRCGLPFNYLYYLLKRESNYKKINQIKRVSAFLFMGLSIFCLPLLILLTLLEAKIKKGGTITIISRKK